jgi:hypothetical protein
MANLSTYYPAPITAADLGLGAGSNATFGSLTANNGTLTASAPVLNLAQTWNNAAVTFTGLRFNATNTASATASPLIDLQVGGVSRMRMTRGGTLHLSEHSNSGLYSPAPVWTGSTAGLLAATNLAIGSNLDTILERGGAGIIEQRNAANAQEYRLFNTFTSATNHERGFLKWSSNVFQIGTEKGSGGGTARALELRTDNVARISIGSAGQIGFFGAAAAAQPTAVADATDAATVITQLNALLSRMRTLGLIAT